MCRVFWCLIWGGFLLFFRGDELVGEVSLPMRDSSGWSFLLYPGVESSLFKSNYVCGMKVLIDTSHWWVHEVNFHVCRNALSFCIVTFWMFSLLVLLCMEINLTVEFVYFTWVTFSVVNAFTWSFTLHNNNVFEMEEKPTTIFHGNMGCNWYLYSLISMAWKSVFLVLKNNKVLCVGVLNEWNKTFLQVCTLLW